MGRAPLPGPGLLRALSALGSVTCGGLIFGAGHISHRCSSLLQSLSGALLLLRSHPVQSFRQALCHSAAELPEDLYMSSRWNSPKIHVSHDDTQIPHQAAFLTYLEMLLFQHAATKTQIGINFRSSYLKYPALLFESNCMLHVHTPLRCLNCWCT